MYATKADADVARRLYELETHHLMNSYLCWCKSWHIGHPGVPRKLRASERHAAAVDELLIGKLIQALKGVINR